MELRLACTQHLQACTARQRGDVSPLLQLIGETGWLVQSRLPWPPDDLWDWQQRQHDVNVTMTLFLDPRPWS